MPAETILSYLSRVSPEEQLKFQIASQCAPVLKGIKVSNIISTSKGVFKIIRKKLKGSKVICIPLCLGEDKDVLLLYRCDLLRSHLNKAEIQTFLSDYGYHKFDVVSVLVRLRSNYQEYVKGNLSFPHELGVILEYPIEDVLGFIKYKGKECLLSSYWKVYHDRERAEQIFRLYDKVRETAMEEILNGYSLELVALS